jgi:hypothetical protein
LFPENGITKGDLIRYYQRITLGRCRTLKAGRWPCSASLMT